MAAPTQPTKIPQAWASAEGADYNVIPATNNSKTDEASASWAEGFPDETSLPLGASGLPVSRKDMNGAFNILSQFLIFLQAGSQFLWDSTQDYAVGAVVRGSDGNLYVAKATSTNVNPVGDTSGKWSALADLGSTQTFTGSKTFTQLINGTANKANQLATARTIAITGGATGTATSFNGTQNISIPVTGLNMGNATAGTLAIARGGTGVTTTADTKAGKDGSGNTITSTYLMKSGGTMTGSITISTANKGFAVSNSTYNVSLLCTSNYCGLYDSKNGEWIVRQDSSYNNYFLGKANTADALQTPRALAVSLSAAYDSDNPYNFDGTTGRISIPVRNTLGIGNGGTGLTASPSMLVNLGSTSAANVLQASPRPGVTGTLPIARGGTGNSAGHATYVSKGTRTGTNGNWTISSLTTGIPLFIVHRNNTSNDGRCTLRVTAGANTGASKGKYSIGVDKTDCFIVFPTATSVTIAVSDMADDDDVLYAFQ